MATVIYSVFLLGHCVSVHVTMIINWNGLAMRSDLVHIHKRER